MAVQTLKNFLSPKRTTNLRSESPVLFCTQWSAITDWCRRICRWTFLFEIWSWIDAMLESARDKLSAALSTRGLETTAAGHPELPSFCPFLSLGYSVLTSSLWVILASFQYISTTFFIFSLVSSSSMLMNESTMIHSQFRSPLIPPSHCSASPCSARFISAPVLVSVLIPVPFCPPRGPLT